jgi:hypothetical protein
MGKSSNAAEYRAKALACEERARNEPLYVVKLQYNELARQWCSLAVQLERLEAEQARKQDCIGGFSRRGGVKGVVDREIRPVPCELPPTRQRN